MCNNVRNALLVTAAAVTASVAILQSCQGPLPHNIARRRALASISRQTPSARACDPCARFARFRAVCGPPHPPHCRGATSKTLLNGAALRVGYRARSSLAGGMQAHTVRVAPRLRVLRVICPA